MFQALDPGRVLLMKIDPAFRPELDPGFLPAALWHRAYANAVNENANANARAVRFAIERENGPRWVYETRMLPPEPDCETLNRKYAERLLKFLLWAWGGHRIRVGGAPELVSTLATLYSPEGARAFDYEFLGERCFRAPFTIEKADFDALVSTPEERSADGIDLRGNRIGFDLGGSDRKCAALINGKVVHSEEIPWDPYFETDPAYHRAGIQDSIERAAAHLPHVDAIGGSAAGIYIDNEPRVGSLFRGIGKEDFQTHILPIFKDLRQSWGDIPFAVANDGDVTAIAGAMAIRENAVLGISMGTSLAGGYIASNGRLTGWLNELAFAPIDYREDAPADEWSGDRGCGASYFSQQAVGRLLPASGIPADNDLGLPEKLELVQARMDAGDERAAALYSTIGTYFGYAMAQYAEFYEYRHLLFLGRVSSGPGGRIILDQARRVLDAEFPDLSPKISFQTPDEKTKRHGQAIAAASLPRL